MKQSILILEKNPGAGDIQPPHVHEPEHHDFKSFIQSFISRGDRTALTIRRFIRIESYTYSQLHDLAHQTAHFLDARGVKPNDRIMVAANNSPQWVMLFLGCQLMGVTLVPVDARNTYETITTFADQTKPVLTFRSQGLLQQMNRRDDVLLLDDLVSLIADQPTTPVRHHLTGHETAVIVFTSGTTAAPKGVVLTQKNILANVYASKRALTVDQDWRFMSVLPLSHMYELTGGCTVPLASGASVYYLSRVTPGAIAKGLKEYKITIMLAVPQLLVLFLDKIRKTAASEGQREKFEKALTFTPRLPIPLRRLLFKKVHDGLGGHLKIIVTGGAPIPLDVDKAWEAMGVVTIQGYGLTETAPVLTMNTVHKRFYESQGHVVDNISVRIAKDHEIQAKGPSIFSEYFNNPTATNEAFTDDGWFKTGDIGRIDNGWLRIQGRAKFAIVRSSGLKVFPEDIEVVADKNDLFKELCVVGQKKADGEVVHLSVITDASDQKVESAVAAINQQLESFQHIDAWSRWDGDAFPRTRLLKIDRKNVQAAVNEAADKKTGTKADASVDNSDKLVNIIRQVLNEPTLDIKDTAVLSDIGLDSLRRLAITSLIEDELNVSVSEAKITQKTTVKQLRELVKTGTAVKEPAKRPEWPYHPVIRFIGNGIRNTVLTSLTNFYVTTNLRGTENLKDLQGPAIFIFNHVDGLDGPVLYKSLPKRFKNKLAVALADDLMNRSDYVFTGFMARLCFAAFNFARKEPFTPSLEYVGTLVARGYNIALAPEGHLGKGGHLEPFKNGIGLLAVELGISVVPIKTNGLYGVTPLTKKWPQKHAHISVTIGQPISFHHDDNYDSVTKKLHDIVENM